MKISVIMPVYNSEKYLESTISSVLFQENAELEIIAVDDCSQDRSAEILSKIADNDPRVRAYFNAENLGVAATRNLAIKYATGDYVAFCDSDDVIPDGAYSKLLSVAGDNDIIAGSYDKIYENGRVSVEHQKTGESNPSPFSTVFSISSLCNKLFKRDFILKSGVSFDEKMRIGEDVIFLAELVAHSPKCAAVDYVVYHYFQRTKSDNSSLTHTYNIELFSQHIECKMRVLKICNGIDEAEHYVYIQSVPYLYGILSMLSGDERIHGFELYKKHLLSYDFSSCRELFFSLTGVPFDGFDKMSFAEYFELRNSVLPRETVLSEFRCGAIGLRWILSYFKAWMRYKFGCRK